MVAAGGIFPLLAAGTEATVAGRLAAALRSGVLRAVGFRLDEAHLPVLPSITLSEYDDCCAAADLTLVDRFATWDAAPTTAAATPSVSTAGDSVRVRPAVHAPRHRRVRGT